MVKFSFISKVAFVGCMMVPTKAVSQTMDAFIDNLMNRMTIEEKVGQLNLLPGGDVVTGGKVDAQMAQEITAGRLGAVLNVVGQQKIRDIQELAVKKSRLGIPLIIGQDVIHGYETIFPIPLAQSCSWDLEAIERGAAIAAREATADGVNWVYSPMVDIALDSRWGRIAEGSGEDPFLGSRIAEAVVRGYQGGVNFQQQSDAILPVEHPMACLKHYALYGAAEAGLDYSTVDMSRQRMYNQYFPPYEAAVRAGVGSVMTSFNIVEGLHATAHPWLLKDVLRSQWGFNGFIVTDYESIGEMTIHGLGDQPQCAVDALKASTDMDMCSSAFVKYLVAALREGKISQQDIDTACRRVLVAKWRMGLFQDPYRHLDKKRLKEIFSDEHRQTARDFAPETFVLLKNKPLRSSTTGEGLLPLTPEKLRLLAHGSSSAGETERRQGRIALIGPLADDRGNLSGTWAFNAKPERYTTIREALQKAVKGKAELLYAQGSNVWYDEATQQAGEWSHRIPRGDDAALREEALRIARQADVIVCAMGETAEMSGESGSRSMLELPDAQLDLLKQLATIGKPIVLLNFSGRATVMKWESEHVEAIMNVWFAGSETADAIADVLFGVKAPSGKLTVSMPQSTGQLPLYYNSLRTGRDAPADSKTYVKYQSNYLDVRNGPLYPFGYGLTYTSFAYGNPTVSSEVLPIDGHQSCRLTVRVTNTGQRAGDEIVQFYIHDPAAQLQRPRKELKGFERIHLEAGESRDVTFSVTPDLLRYYNHALQHVIDPGEIQLFVGPNSRDLKRVSIQLVQ